MNVTLLYGGGLDSRILYHYAEVQTGKTPRALWYDIGQRYAGRERARLPAFVAQRSIDWLRGEPLTYANPGSVVGPITIPGRNLALAVAAACATLCDEVWLGAVAGEPILESVDKNAAFLATASAALTQVLQPWKPDGVRVRFPFVEAKMNKIACIEWALRNGLSREDLEATNSCVGEGEGHCGVCSSCFRRWAAFAAFGFKTEYAEPPLRCELHKQMVRALVRSGRHDEYRRDEVLPVLCKMSGGRLGEDLLAWIDETYGSPVDR